MQYPPNVRRLLFNKTKKLSQMANTKIPKNIYTYTAFCWTNRFARRQIFYGKCTALSTTPPVYFRFFYFENVTHSKKVRQNMRIRDAPKERDRKLIAKVFLGDLFNTRQ